VAREIDYLERLGYVRAKKGSYSAHLLLLLLLLPHKRNRKLPAASLFRRGRPNRISGSSRDMRDGSREVRRTCDSACGERICAHSEERCYWHPFHNGLLN